MQFKNQLATQSKDLNDRASQLGKTARSLEQKYRSSHQRFERAYQAAAAACSQIIDLGGTPPKAPDPHLIYKKYGLDKVPRQTNHHSPSGERREDGKAQQRLLLVPLLSSYPCLDSALQVDGARQAPRGRRSRAAVSRA